MIFLKSIRKSIVCLLLLVLALPVQAQETIARLKYEEAEEAFAAGKYETTLAKLAEVEKMLKSSNSKILYLRIMAQDQWWKSKPTPDPELIARLKKDCGIYMAKYENQEGIEDKFRDVYRLSEALNIFSVSEQMIANAGKGVLQDMEQLALSYELLNNHEKAISWYTKAAAAGSSNAMVKLVWYHEERLILKGDVVKMHELLNRAMAAGNALAYGVKGRLLLTGVGSDMDTVKANEVFKQGYDIALPGAEKGDVESMYATGVILANSDIPAPVGGVTWLERAAEQGHADARYAAACFYSSRKRQDRLDSAKAMYWFEQAEQHQDKRIYTWLGNMYYYRAGVVKNKARAEAYYRKGDSCGDARCARNLGIMHFNRDVAERSDEKSTTALFNKAVQGGCYNAYVWLGVMYLQGTHVSINYPQAAAYFQKGVEAGDANSMVLLGWMYQIERVDGTANYDKAIELMQQAINNGEGLGWGYLADIWMNKRKGIPADYNKALLYYLKGASLGSPYCMGRMAYLFENGDGFRKNKQAAAEWTQKYNRLKEN